MNLLWCEKIVRSLDAFLLGDIVRVVLEYLETIIDTSASIKIHTLEFDNDTWYSIDDLAGYLNWTPYVLKYPEYSIEIKTERKQDTVDYVQKKEFLNWLKYQKDERCPALYAFLSYGRRT